MCRQPADSGPLQAVGCRRWLPVLVFPHARQAEQTLLSGGPSQGTAEPTERHGHHDVVHAGG